MNKVTIQDIAQAANVSKSTVSRVLNGTAVVNQEKAKAVLEAIDRLGFKPNAVAQSLANGKSMTIGVLTQMIGSPFYDAIAQGVIAGLADSMYSPIFVDGRWHVATEVEAIRALLGRRVDGLLLIGGDLTSSDITDLCDDIPTVVVARKLPADQQHCIFTNNIAGGHLATKHLIENGHREIAIILGVEHHPDAVDRLTGYMKALSDAGIAMNPDLIIQGDFTAKSGVDAINRLHDRNQTFTAVFAANDTTAYGARLALHRHGLRVPEDVSLIGFDDQAESEFMTPPLTTVRQPAREMGTMAARGILGLLDGESFENVKLEGELQIRESTAGVRS